MSGGGGHADQHLAEQAVAGRLAGAGLGGALVSLDPATGAVVAMVGGRDFASSKVNLATGQGGGGFPPGSSFKVFYLVAALEQGIPASTSFDTAWPATASTTPSRPRPAASPWPRPAPSPSRPTTPS
jgi:membrane carboxypeptidase/penicillin-binding protein